MQVRCHDFKDKQLGKVNPYGVYDIAGDEGYVSVGIDADTAQFAVASIRSWWAHLGTARYPDATTLTITADCGGSNGNRTRLWKTELQRLADETGLQICVCHFPPGTSKWNKIEHRLISYIARNWRGQPLVSRQAVVSLIAATTSTAGLKVYAQLDENSYERGVKVPCPTGEQATGTVTAQHSAGADRHGYQELLRFAEGKAAGARVWAIEGTGSYGAGLTAFLAEHGEWVVEIDRPKRPARRNGRNPTSSTPSAPPMRRSRASISPPLASAAGTRRCVS